MGSKPGVILLAEVGWGKGWERVMETPVVCLCETLGPVAIRDHQCGMYKTAQGSTFNACLWMWPFNSPVAYY